MTTEEDASKETAKDINSERCTKLLRMTDE